jgi:hypothetical protein
MRQHKFEPGALVTRDEKRYRIVHHCHERTSMGEPRYVATLLNPASLVRPLVISRRTAPRTRNVVIVEGGLEAADAGEKDAGQ